MKEKLKVRLVLGFTILYMLFFAIWSIIRNNYEFMFYIIFVSLLIVFVSVLYKKLHLPFYVLVFLSILGVLHFIGGNVYLGGIRTYDRVFFGDIIRYDNILHWWGTLIFTFVGYNLLRPHLDMRVKHNPFLLSAILILIALGFGVFNEIVELLGVVFFQGAEGVGGYMNNALDLVYNAIGAIMGSILIVRYHKKMDKS